LAESAKSADFWLLGRHVADMSATFPAKNNGNGRHDNGKGQHGDGWHDDGKEQKGNRRHNDGGGRHNEAA